MTALEERVRQLLQHNMAMLRLRLTPTEYVASKLGCSYEQAERLVRSAQEKENER